MERRMTETSGKLADNILYFARALRAAGMPVGPGAVLDALSALEVAHVGNRDDVYWTLHAVFVKRREHSILFDQAFRIFFRRRGLMEKMLAAMLPETLPSAPKPPEAGAQRIQDALLAGMNRPEREQEVELDARLTVSDREVLQKKDFAQMTAAEIATAKDAIARLALPFELVRTRRLAASRRGRHHRSAAHLARQHESGRRRHRPQICRPASRRSRRSSRSSTSPAR